MQRGSDALRRLIVFVNVAANVGMLAYFKYFNLIADTLSHFTTMDIRVETILLPAGISFFTFRSISYIVDLYRRQLKAYRNLLDYIFLPHFLSASARGACGQS